MSDSPFSDRLVRHLADAERVAVLTGAGISAESGIPTFRDPGGLWQRFKPEELANVDAFLQNPVLVQGWYAHRREVATGCAPNPGHRALAELEALVGAFALITQNVDNLHQRAGSQRVLELHGNIMRSYCVDCGRPAEDADLPAAAVPGAASSGEAAAEAAQCPACSGLLRPDVVWFGEWLPPDTFEAAAQAARTADVFLSIGTSAVVYPAAGLPLLAKEHGAFVAEVNVERSAIAGGLDEVVLGPAGEVMPRLVEAVRTARAA